MKRTRSARKAVVLVGVAVSVVVGMAALLLVDNAAAPKEVQETAVVQVVELDDVDGGVCLADRIIEGETVSFARGNKPCKECPRMKGCTIIDCDSCCYACIGEPLPICMQ